MKCRVCAGETRHEFAHTILRAHTCDYFFCPECGFLQTETPHWLDEAYQSAIANADTGLVQRNLLLSNIVATLLFTQFDHTGRYLDVAGGYGMLTRLMRDVGFDFYWSDLYCENKLARGFEAETTSPPFTAITAFEVMEHLPEPLAFLDQVLSQAQTRTVIFSTELYEGTPPKPGAWWYYAFETGQHIAFYQRRTLETLAKQLGLRCYSNRTVHMLTDREISPVAFNLFSHPRVSTLFTPFIRRALGSKMMSDHELMLTGR